MKGSLRETLGLRAWRPFELVWMFLFLGVGTVVTLVTEDSLLSYVILITGILCVLLAAKGNLWNYLFGTLNSVGYAFVSFTNGLYGDMGLNVLFFLPTNVIGFFMWKSHLESASVEMRGLRVLHQILVALACAAAIGALGFGLSQIKTQNTPYLDATSTILSIAATLLMMWRYKEQWLLYIVLNAVTIVMWGIRLAHGSPEGLMMILMWTAFLANAVYGYINWSKGALRQRRAGVTG